MHSFLNSHLSSPLTELFQRTSFRVFPDKDTNKQPRMCSDKKCVLENTQNSFFRKQQVLLKDFGYKCWTIYFSRVATSGYFILKSSFVKFEASEVTAKKCSKIAVLKIAMKILKKYMRISWSLVRLGAHN